MTEKTKQSVANLGYHAHIYYDPAKTRAVAERVCAAIGEKFKVEVEEFRDTPRGPHPISNALVIFKPEEFERVVPYLMPNRYDLTCGPPADDRRGRGPQQLRDLARQPGRTKAAHFAARPRRAASERGQPVGGGRRPRGCKAAGARPRREWDALKHPKGLGTS